MLRDYTEIYKQLLISRKEMDSNLLTEKKRRIWEYFRNIGIPLTNIEKNMVVPCKLYKAPLDVIIPPAMLLAYPIDNDYQIYINDKLLLDKNNYELIMCQLTHEELHILTHKVNGLQAWFFYGYTHVGIDEAVTQIYTEEIENKILNEEEDPRLYFIKNIMRVFKAIIGNYELAYQYTNCGTLFEEKFNRVTGNKFPEFNQAITEIYHLVSGLKLGNLSSSDKNRLDTKKEQLLKFTKRIISENIEMLPSIKKQLEGTGFLDVLDLKENMKK